MDFAYFVKSLGIGTLATKHLGFMSCEVGSLGLSSDETDIWCADGHLRCQD